MTSQPFAHDELSQRYSKRNIPHRRSCPAKIQVQPGCMNLDALEGSKGEHQDHGQKPFMLQHPPTPVAGSQPQGGQPQITNYGCTGPSQNGLYSSRIDRRSPPFPARQRVVGHDTDIPVSEESDTSNASVDFLATLRQIDPKRALDLERR